MAIKTYKKGTAVTLSTNFKSTEFDCHGSGCCSSTKVDEKLVEYLQKIRDHFGKSVNINSGTDAKLIMPALVEHLNLIIWMEKPQILELMELLHLK